MNEATKEREPVKAGHTYKHYREDSTVRVDKVDDKDVHWKHLSGSLVNGEREGKTPIRDFSNDFREEKAA